MALVPTIIRAYSITWNIWAMPSCLSPNRYPTAGVPWMPKLSSQVVETFSPILCSRPVTKTPLRSPSSPVAGSKWNFGTMNRLRPLVPGRFSMPGPSGPGQHQMHDVLGEVLLGGGDEPLHALEVPAAVGLLDRLGPARADVAAGVRLGQHHGRAPLLLDHGLGHLLLQRGAVAVHDGGEVRAAGVHEQGRVGAQHQLGRRPAQAR